MDMTFQDWLSLLAQIATWATVLLVLFTFFEMVKQRKSTYRPDLVVSRLTVFGYMNQGLLPGIWLDEDKDFIEETSEVIAYPRLHLRVHNLGLGAARDVHFAWEFDINKMARSISDLQAASGDSIEIKLHEDGFLFLEYGTHASTGINTKVDMTHEADFILPAAVGEPGHNLPFPMAYVDLMAILLAYDLRALMQDSVSGSPRFLFEPLRLVVRYKDIGGANHSKEFDLQPTLIGIRSGERKPGSRVFSAILEVK